MAQVVQDCAVKAKVAGIKISKSDPIFASQKVDFLLLCVSIWLDWANIVKAGIHI